MGPHLTSGHYILQEHFCLAQIPLFFTAHGEAYGKPDLSISLPQIITHHKCISVSHSVGSNSLDCSWPGSSAHGILQARMLEWVAMPFSRGSSWPRDWTWVSCVAGRFLTIWATREALSAQVQTGQFRSVQSLSPADFLEPHGLQHTRLPCPSKSPRGYSNSRPSRRWCHPTISSSVVPFSSCLQSFPVLGSFPMSQLFASGGESIGVSASASALQRTLRILELTGWIFL